MPLIEQFDVPPDAEEDFIAAWRREGARGTLLRAVRPDAPARFISLSDSAQIVHEDGPVDEPDGVLLVAALEPAESFMTSWHRLRDLFAGRRGYLGTRLYRDADEYVHVGRWSSPLMVFRTTRDPGFAALAEPIGFPAQPTLYQRVAGG